ncbi:MAG TPA: helix-turn-helix domain-containing protein, partial [Streptosporangiaceae bacterium]|nr:helix-turn-helix domain-containing protein [Streptosporangiaceae bacterium]
MDVAAIAKVAFTSEDRVRDVIHNFNADGFSSLYPKYKGGRPPKFTLPQRREIKKIAKSRPAGHGLPFSIWSLSKLAEFLVAEHPRVGQFLLLAPEGNDDDIPFAGQPGRQHHFAPVEVTRCQPRKGRPRHRLRVCRAGRRSGARLRAAGPCCGHQLRSSTSWWTSR